MNFVARVGDREIPLTVERRGSAYAIRMDGRERIADLVQAGPSLRTLRFPDGRQFLLLAHRDGSEYRITLAGRKVEVMIEDPLAVRRAGMDHEPEGEATIRASMPGRVIRVLCSAGEQVRKGQGIVILEAMKMENEISAPRDGRVAEVHVAGGATVERGTPLVTLE
ncbi:MAG TPA: biotin/lipoyl-containing protein [Thermoanaerobaculia bacterium]|nr:biotin/lipoyl-containing protein [Thermoanaerobaculia bacterium]